MASKAFSQNAFLIPEVREEAFDEPENRSKTKKPSVYDAVAGNSALPGKYPQLTLPGRISTSGFIPKIPLISSNRDTSSSSKSAVAPESVLFRSKNAPTRYAELDIYFANERDSPTLPESSLLKTLHSYTSDYYSRITTHGGTDWRSLDETALIALGILMEEASLEILGETGDLVFLEGDKEQNPKSGRFNTPAVQMKRKRAKKRRILGNGT
ncbi:hypothetical protein B7494_g3347 [Chlorociboria aeruginascens]|nr:hypothetical protein B7494_g3347 [Chlorociboria aeruginascens]